MLPSENDLIELARNSENAEILENTYGAIGRDRSLYSATDLRSHRTVLFVSIEPAFLLRYDFFCPSQATAFRIKPDLRRYYLASILTLMLDPPHVFSRNTSRISN